VLPIMMAVVPKALHMERADCLERLDLANRAERTKRADSAEASDPANSAERTRRADCAEASDLADCAEEEARSTTLLRIALSVGWGGPSTTLSVTGLVSSSSESSALRFRDCSSAFSAWFSC
jgi:hypothetical protein